VYWLLPADVAAITRSQGTVISCASAVVGRDKSLQHNERTTRATLLAVEPDYFCVRKLHATEGRVLSEVDERLNARVAVLGESVAEALFGDAGVAVGETLMVDRIPFLVVGRTNRLGADTAGNDLDNVIYLPLTCGMERVFHTRFIDSIVLAADPSARVSMKAAIPELLTHRRRLTRPGPYAVSELGVVVEGQALAAQAFRPVAYALVMFALVAGGVGIVTVMNLSVKERLLEIGLRRAFGARRRDIRAQFILEAAGVALAGGTLGVPLGLVVNALLLRWNSLPPVVPVFECSAGLVVALALGGVAGLVPARRAARVPPVEALRPRA
ncbi:MAG: ABC transporter permease, partial [Acidobacteriota bacterium]